LVLLKNRIYLRVIDKGSNNQVYVPPGRPVSESLEVKIKIGYQLFGRLNVKKPMPLRDLNPDGNMPIWSINAARKS
jgi:hypothetical protein